MPIWLGIFAALSWVLLCATLFCIAESWPYSLAVYFTFLTLTTNSLGNVAPSRVDYVLAISFIFLGLCFVSMLVSIIQSNIENFIKRVERDIDQHFKERMIQVDAEPDDRTPEEVVKEIIATYKYPWLNSLISEQRMQALIDSAAEKAGIELKECQTELEMAAFVPNHRAGGQDSQKLSKM